ncbi:MAG: protein kinase [Kofleriaceae bacterium]
MHRDLKPDNVFLVPDPDMPSGERPKVLDFGIAKLNDEGGKVNQTRTGTLMGTPAYMAPEQARAAGEIDHRADLYSLGCMVYEMLTGAPPFVAEGAGELIAMQLFGQVPPLRERLPEVSVAMDGLVAGLLAKDAASRPQSAADIIEALTRAIPSLTGAITSMTPLPTARRSAVVIPVGTAPGTVPGVAALGSMPTLAGDTALLAAERPAVARSGSKLGLVAGLVTVVLVGAGVAFFALRDRGDAAPSSTTATGSAGSAGPVAITDPTAGQAVVSPPVGDETVAVFFELTPPSARVLLDGVEVTLTDRGIAELPRRATAQPIRVAAAGYDEFVGEITLDGPQRFEVELRRGGGKAVAKVTAVAPTRTDPATPRNGDKPGGDKPGGDKPGGDKPGGDKPGGDKPGGVRVGDKPIGDPATVGPVTAPGDPIPGGDGPATAPDSDKPTTASGAPIEPSLD